MYFPDESQRQSPRFVQQWQCQVTTEKETFAAYTLDVAEGGVKLGVPTPNVLTLNTPLKLQLTRSLQLTGKVVGFNREQQYANVQLVFQEEAQQCQWQALLDTHLKQQDPLLEHRPSASEQQTIRDNLCCSLPMPCFFLSQTRQGLNIQSVGVAQLPKVFHFLRRENETLDLTPIFKGKLKWLHEQVHTSQCFQPYQDCLIVQNPQGNWQIEVCPDWGESLGRRLKFETARVVRITLRRITQPKEKICRTSLGALAKHTLHHAKQLEEKLDTLVGLGTLEDITDMVHLFTENSCITTPTAPQSHHADP